MPNYNATATLLAKTGNTRDVNVNGFAISTTSPLSSTDQTNWANEIADFYSSLLSVAMLNGREQNGHSIKIYAADTGVPNYPIYETAFNLSSDPLALDLPDEVSLCVSYANDSANSVPRGRRRGRIYISGQRESSNLSGRPTTAAYEGLCDAFKDYCDAVNAISDLSAGVWSRANATVYPIERVWCDNEWDTMRSRGGRATARKTVSV